MNDNDKGERAALEQEVQRLRRELANLDEMQRKRRPTVSDLSGVSDLNTSVSKGIRSMPGTQDRYYLDLYLLQKERDRLAKETTWIKKRRLRIGRKVAEIGKDMAEKEETAIQHMAILTEAPAAEERGRAGTAPSDKEPKKKYDYKKDEWKQMSLDY